jgi:catechol 2,3-dioxygenase-like lactoylglutathione lyase family enzyme
MLTNSKLQTIIWTADISRAEQFYTHILGLTYVQMSHGALVYRVTGGDLRISPVPATRPTEHTVLGFAVTDIQAVVNDLKAQGVELERFPHFPHGENGILKISGGDQVAWFRDPDGNLLSVVEYANAGENEPL